ncbi:MAG: hypothetical protein RL346_1304 [Verrucomicrobiota bacterium]
MKQVVLGIFIGLVAGCAVKSRIPVPDQLMADRSGQNLTVLQRGHAVYMSHCSRCHEPMMPSMVSGEDWHTVVPGMAWNAGISRSDEQAVLKYILAAR